MSGPKKLIFAGLDQAGKTTIYKATMEEMSVQEMGDQQRPTRGIERHNHDFLDHDFSVWDLGGQVNYRETYLSKPEVFNQTAAMIFVVDIQDIERLDEAYQYYVDIINILINVEPVPKLYVFFHKFDPDKVGKLRSHFYKATRMFRQADHLIRQKFKGYATSIYSNSINLAVKRILFENFEDYQEPTGSVKIKPKTEVKVDKEKDDSSTVPTPSGDDSASTPTPSTESKPKSSAPVPEMEKPEEGEEKEPSPGAPTPEVTSEEEEVEKTAKPEKAAELEKPEKVEELEKPEEVEEEKDPLVTPEEDLSDEEKEDLERTLDEATPKVMDEFSDEIVEKLTSIINKRMKETPEIVALSILSSEGKQALAVAKNEIDYDRLATLREVVGSLNPKQFFKDLTDIEYRGLGHFSLSDFDIYFARASDDYAIAVLATDVSTLMLQNAQRIVRSIRQALGMVSDDDELDDDDEDESDKKSGKRDLVADLRGRLKSITGLDNI